MKKRSAGCLIFKVGEDGKPLFFLAKPTASGAKHGIPKGMLEEGEAAILAALRETEEETSLKFKPITYIGEVKYKSGKVVECFLAKYIGGEFKCTSYFDHKYLGSIPEVEDGRFFTYEEAMKSIMDAQKPFLKNAMELLRRDSYANL